MKLFKKVLFDLFPKILFVQLISHALLLFIAVKAIPVNTQLHSFFNKWDIPTILLIAILGTLIFAPKVFKIVFMEPNKGQRTTRIALLSFIFMNIAIPNFFLNRFAIFHFGKTKNVVNISEVQTHPDYSFFTIEQSSKLDIDRNAYYINDHVTGKNKKTFHIDIYASKLIENDNKTVIIGKQYRTDYDGRPSSTFAQKMMDKDLETAAKDFEQLDLSSKDTLVRTFESFSRKQYLAAAQLIDKNINLNSIILEAQTYNITHMKRKSLIIYFGFILFLEMVLVFFLASGKYFKE